MRFDFRQQVWMVGVRRRGSHDKWTVTGPGYFHWRKGCAEYIRNGIVKTNFDFYEYKPVKLVMVEALRERGPEPSRKRRKG